MLCPCGYEFDDTLVGIYGCSNCNGESMDTHSRTLMKQLSKQQLKTLSSYVDRVEKLIDDIGIEDDKDNLLDSDFEDNHFTVRYIIEMLEKKEEEDEQGSN